jgi:hypothetical protein
MNRAEESGDRGARGVPCRLRARRRQRDPRHRLQRRPRPGEGDPLGRAAEGHRRVLLHGGPGPHRPHVGAAGAGRGWRPGHPGAELPLRPRESRQAARALPGQVHPGPHEARQAARGHPPDLVRLARPGYDGRRRRGVGRRDRGPHATGAARRPRDAAHARLDAPERPRPPATSRSPISRAGSRGTRSTWPPWTPRTPR